MTILNIISVINTVHFLVPFVIIYFIYHFFDVLIFIITIQGSGNVRRVNGSISIIYDRKLTVKPCCWQN